MKLNDYSSLLSELRKGERQRVYILTGERGLGKHSVLSAAAETIKETAPDATILSVHPDAFSFSLWPMEEALRQSTPDAALPSHEMKDGLNYPEQLIRSILELCSGKKRTIIFLNRLQSFNDDLWSFTTKLLRLLLDPYRSFNVCFCCCLHTDGVLRSQSSTQTRSADQLIGLFSRYPQSTCYLYFHPWSREGLQRFLENELFQGKLRMAPGQRGLLLDAAMGNPATLINLTERMKARGLLYEENGFYCCGSIDGTVLLTCGPVPATEEYTRMDAQCSYCVVLYESGEISRPLEHLRTLLSELQKETGPQAASILVRTLSCLTSIEETLCDPMHEFHFNAALDIAKRYHLEDEYYVLLRKSLIVHKGVYGISLMESARVYFERIGNQKELARTLCNLAAELLLHGDLEQARSNYQHSAEILRSFGAETIYVPINGLGDYWCLRGNFERALSLFEEAYREEYDAFTRIAIRINQATAHRKLGHYDAAAERLAQAEKISNSGDAAEYAILLPHLLIGKALLLYDRGELEEAYPLFLKYIQEDPSFGRRRLALAGQYIQKICAYFQRPVPDGVDAFAKATSPADERLLRHGITLIRFSITE